MDAESTQQDLLDELVELHASLLLQPLDVRPRPPTSGLQIIVGPHLHLPE